MEIHIHPKASFANQEGIFSDDVITSIENLIQKGSLRYHYLIKLNLTFSELSNKHFLIKSPKPISISSLVQIGLLPITQRKSLENNQKNPEPSGAYHIQSTKNNHYHILKRNKNYWAKDLPSQANMNHFDTIKIIYVSTSSVSLNLFKKHEIDYLWVPVYENWKSILNLSSRKPHLKTKLFDVIRPISMKGLSFNMKKPIFQNQKIREAFNLAFDYDSINKSLFGNNTTRLSSYLTNTPFQGTKINNPFDIEKADQLLTEQGWIVEKGIRKHHKTKKPLFLRIVINDKYNEKIVNIYSDDLKKLGIGTRIITSTNADYIQTIQQGEFELAYYRMESPILSWKPVFNTFIQQPKLDTNYANIFSLNNHVIKKKVEHAESTTNEIERNTIIKDIDQYLMQEYYFIPFWYSKKDHIAHWDNIDGPSTSFILFPSLFYKYWWPTTK